MSRAAAPDTERDLTRYQSRLALAVADAGWFTTEHLFRAVDPARADTLLLQCIDFENARRKQIPIHKWIERTQQTSVSTWERRHVLPPGWMSQYPRLGMLPITGSIRRWYRQVEAGASALVMTYPQYSTIAEQLQPDLQIYYNVDDYRLYWPERAQQIDRMERDVVARADFTVCVAHYRAEELRASVPEAAEKIFHIPHGAPSESLCSATIHRPGAAPADVAHLPRPLIGYVGSLEDRVDWALLNSVARAFPAASLVLVGKPERDGASAEWRQQRAECLARPNVHTIGWRAQKLIPLYNRSFDLALIPYAVGHPFNTACCPTKIMDSFATGRPVVSTALPECQRQSGLLHVAEDSRDFLEAIASILDRNSDDGLGELRFEAARSNTCEIVVSRLIDRMDLILRDRHLGSARG